MGATESRITVQESAESIQQANIKIWFERVLADIEANELGPAPSRDAQLAIIDSLVVALNNLDNKNLDKSKFQVIKQALCTWVEELNSQREASAGQIKLDTKRFVLGERVYELPIDLLNALSLTDGQKIALSNLSQSGTSIIHRDATGTRAIEGVTSEFLSLLLSDVTTNIRNGELWYCGWVDGNKVARILILSNEQYQLIFSKK